MHDVALSCQQCGAKHPLPPGKNIYRHDACAQCDCDLHSCVHCRFFDASRNNQCAEPQAEWVKDKDRANFCDYFEPRTGVGSSNRDGGANRTGGARSAFDDLFKK